MTAFGNVTKYFLRGGNNRTEIAMINPIAARLVEAIGTQTEATPQPSDTIINLYALFEYHRRMRDACAENMMKTICSRRTLTADQYNSKISEYIDAHTFHWQAARLLSQEIDGMRRLSQNILKGDLDEYQKQSRVNVQI